MMLRRALLALGLIAVAMSLRPRVHRTGGALADAVAFARSGAGGQWEVFDSPATPPLEAIHMLSPTHGWAGGGSGRLLHWDGRTWSAAQSPTTLPIRSIAMLSPTDGWAVASDWVSSGGGPPPMIPVPNPHTDVLRWDGTAWGSQAAWSSNSLMYGVDMPSPSFGLMVGRFTKGARWNGSTWQGTAAPSMVDMYGVAAVSNNLAWAVGAKAIGDSNILRWYGDAWDEVDSPRPEEKLFAVDALSASDVWAVGSNATIVHWDGRRWAAVDCAGCPSVYLRGVAMRRADDGWAVGDGGTLLHWDGTAWSVAESPTDRPLTAISAVPDGDVWAVGDSVMLRYVADEEPTATSASTLTPSAVPSSTRRPSPSPSPTRVRTPEPAFMPYLSKDHVLRTPTRTPTPTVTPTPTRTPLPSATPRFCPSDLKTGTWSGSDGNASITFKVNGDRRSVRDIVMQSRTQCGGGRATVSSAPIVNCSFSAQAPSGGLLVDGLVIFKSAAEGFGAVGVINGGCGSWWLLTVKK